MYHPWYLNIDLNAEWIDLPKLKTIILGDRAFHDSLTTVIEGIDNTRMKIAF